MNQFSAILGLINIAVDLVGKIKQMRDTAARNRELTDDEIRQLDEKIEQLTKSEHWKRR